VNDESIKKLTKEETDEMIEKLASEGRVSDDNYYDYWDARSRMPPDHWDVRDFSPAFRERMGWTDDQIEFDDQTGDYGDYE